MYDCIIIGAGAAGVSAALTLKALNKNLLWLGASVLSGKISGAEKIKNYPGLPSVSGKDMQKVFLAQIEEAGLSVTQRTVTGVYDLGGSFGVLCGDETFSAKTVILATGVESVKPIVGELEFLGRGVSYCATCDGFLYKGKRIAIICTSKDFAHEAQFLADLAQKAYVVPLCKGLEVKGDNVEVIKDMPKSVEGDLRVKKVKFGDGEIDVDGVFMLKNAVTPSALVHGLETRDGHVAVDRSCATNLKGLFAAGDCTGRPYQYAKAVGEGNVAAHSVAEYLAQIK